MITSLTKTKTNSQKSIPEYIYNKFIWREAAAYAYLEERRGDDKLTSETLILRLMNINDLTDLGLVDLFPINGLFYGP